MDDSKKFQEKYLQIESEIPKVAELMAIPVEENADPMVEITAQDGLVISFHNSAETVELIGKRMIVRSQVREMLLAANEQIRALRESVRIKIFYGYRALSVQEKYYRGALEKVRSAYPEQSEEWILQFAHTLAAYPAIAGHPTGAAVDVTLFDLATNRDVDMGVPVYREAFRNAGRKIYTESPEIVGEQMENRLLLRSVMAGGGFAPFSGEFWHFSYGDCEWAAKLRKREAFYGPLSVEEVLEMVGENCGR